ncbi:MAG TPA: HAD family hydrolase [Candidatus Saccharimonadales bacterium]|nr:HAD family hydrolase [Candidatus Saccharimonadales bacterium]
MRYPERATYLACDIDRTLQAGDWFPDDQQAANSALFALTIAVKRRKQEYGHVPFYFGTVTGRTLESHYEEVERDSTVFQHAVSEMDLLVGSVGAEMVLRQDGCFVPVEQWPGALSGWNRGKAYEALQAKEFAGELVLQERMAQSDNKLSFNAVLPEPLHEEYAERIRTELLGNGVQSTVIFSGGKYLDILPRMADGRAVNKGAAIEFGATLLAERDSLAEVPQIVFAGDSENDEEGFAYAIESGGFGIIPANAKEPFKRKMRDRYPETKLHIARTARFALAIQEGLEDYGLVP